MSKYQSIKTVVDGIRFDSKKEAHRYWELKILQRQGLIGELEVQPSFKIMVNNQHVCTYIADFSYIADYHLKTSRTNPIRIVEDVKGMKKGAAWSMFRLKQKLMKAVYGIDVRVI